MFDSGYDLSGVVDRLFDVVLTLTISAHPVSRLYIDPEVYSNSRYPRFIILSHQGYRSLGTGAAIGPCNRVDGVTSDARAVHISGGAPVV